MLMLEDLSEHKIFSYNHNLPIEHALLMAKKLAVLHSHYWNDTSLPSSHPGLDWQPDVYNLFFGLKDNYLYSYPTSTEKIQRYIKTWEDTFPLLTDPKINSGLLALTEHYPHLKKNFNRSEKGTLFSHCTLLHGDVNSGNVFFVQDPKNGEPTDFILIDWQSYGIGHPSTEVAYLLSFVDPDPLVDEKLMRVYYDQLTQSVSPTMYPWSVFVREVEIRNIGYLIWSLKFISDTKQGSQRMKKWLQKDGLDHTLFLQRQVNTNLIRFGYTFEKWCKEKIFEEIERNL